MYRLYTNFEKKNTLPKLMEKSVVEIKLLNFLVQELITEAVKLEKTVYSCS